MRYYQRSSVTGGLLKIITILVFGFISLNLWAQDTDPLAEAQAVLTSRLEREKFLKQDKKAQAADDFADRAVGGSKEDKEELYSISAEAVAHLIKVNGADPEKLQEQMLKAIQNPQAFKKSLPQDIQDRMNAVVNKVQSRSPASKSSNP